MRTLIQNGLLIDPSNDVEARLNLLIENGKIVAVTEDAPSAERLIDATDRVVCPGFIDIHMHEDPVRQGRIQNSIFSLMLRMGVTTAVGGNCGENVYDPLEYLEIADRFGTPVNVALFAGHGYFRVRAGGTDKYASIDECCRSKMLSGLKAALAGGCAGVSFGLRYVPGTDETEFRAAAELCREMGKLFSIHLRDDAAGVFAALDEAARVGLACDVPVQISHIGSMAGFGQMSAFLEKIEAYRAAGLDVTCDCYPYEAFSTGIGETTYDAGWLERYGCDYDACVPATGRYRGVPCTRRRFEELRREEPECITVCYVMRAEDVHLALMHNGVMAASDGFMDRGQGHPRAAGCFPRFLRRYALDGEMKLSEGIRRITELPAKRLGIGNKGRLNVGADADVVIFDPIRLQDRASFDAPALAPEGIDYVLINGEVALQKGEICNAKLGHAVRL